MIPIEPYGNRLVVSIDPFVYEGRIKIPDIAKRAPTTGTILAVGPDVDTTKFKIGDRVLYTMYSGTLVQIKSQPAYRVLACEELLGRLTDEAAVLEFTAA